MDVEFKNEVLFQGYWMETAQGFNLWDQDHELNLWDQDHDPQWYLPVLGSNYPSLKSSQAMNQDEMENFIDDAPPEYAEITPSLILSKGFPFEDEDLGKIWWVGNSELEPQEVGSQDSISSTAKVSSPDESCVDDSPWTPGMMMEADNEEEYVQLSRGFPKEEPEEEIKVTSYSGKNELDLNHDQDFVNFVEHQQNSGIYHDFDSSNESCTKRVCSLGIRKPSEKRQTKPEKIISLQVLRQYFAQSLKDAARSLGVCPTTLKRICRQQGINRWPSRKLKKVNHSLSKLQRVVDSVEGVEGLIQIGSIYSSFPELSSPNLPKNNPDSSLKLSDDSDDIKPQQENPTKVKRLTTTTNGFSTDQSSVVWEEPMPIPASQSQCGGILKVKASFGDSNIRFSLQPQWNFKELQLEIAKRFGIDYFSGIHLKYLDNDHESVLLTCDEDLEECKDLFRSSQNQTVKMFLHQSSRPNPKDS